MITTAITLLIAGGVIIYMIFRQLQEQPVLLSKMWLLPVLITYYTYTNITQELSHPIVNIAYLILLMVLGFLIGALIGYYRGGLALIRFELRSKTILAKSSTLSLTIWFAILALRISTNVLLSIGIGKTSIGLTLLFVLMSTLFLGNLLAEKGRLYWRSTQYRLA